jgi:hypothetical protein
LPLCLASCPRSSAPPSPLCHCSLRSVPDIFPHKPARKNITCIPAGWYYCNARKEPQTTSVVEDFFRYVRQPAHCEATRTHTHANKPLPPPPSLVPLDPRVFPTGVRRTACTVLAILLVLVDIHPDSTAVCSLLPDLCCRCQISTLSSSLITSAIFAVFATFVR